MAQKMANTGASRGQKASLKEIFTRDFLAISIINLAVFFGFQMTTVGMPVYVASLGANAQTVGLVTTSITVTALIVRMFAGALLDRFGRKGALVAGIAIMLCAIVAYAIFPFVGIILGLRLLHGLGWGLGSTASSTVAADVIPKRRFAEGMGYFAMTTAVASTLAPALSIQLVQGAGAQYMIAVAACCTAVALILSLMQRGWGKTWSDAGEASGKPPSDTPKAPRRNVPAGRPSGDSEKPSPGAPTGSPTDASGKPPAPAELPLGASGKPPAGSSALGKSATKVEALFERRALLPSVIIMLVNIGFGSITTFIALHSQEQGVPSISFYFLLYAITTLASRPGIGALIDRYGYRMPAILSTLCTAATLALVGVSTHAWMFAVAGVLAGLGIGTAMGTFQAMAVAAVEPWRRGVATSTFMTAFDLGIAIGSMVAGLIAGVSGYTVMYLVISLFPLAACAISAALVKGDRPQR